MGGYLSTRWNWVPTRLETDPLLALDVRKLHRSGRLRPGAVASSHWECRGEPAGDIVTRMAQNGENLTLDYRFRRHGEEWQPVNEYVSLDWTGCNFGGRRPWFSCPGCQRRRAILFSVDGRFRCRTCHNLAYSTTRMDAHERAIRRCQKIQRKLGGGGYGVSYDSLPPKPEGMTWKRYQELSDRLLLETSHVNDLFTADLRRMVARFERHS